MSYFGIKSRFEPFHGQIIGQRQNLGDVFLPHQIIRNGHGNVLLAQRLSGIKVGEIGKRVIIEPPKGDDFSRFVIVPDIGDIEGRVLTAKSFALGRNAFFACLEIASGGQEVVRMAFRPWPSEKRTMGSSLVDKVVRLKGDRLFVLNEKGRGKPWPK